MFVRCFSYVEKLQGRAGAGKKEVKTACCQEWAVSSAQERHPGPITHCSPFPDLFLGSRDCKILEEQMNRARSKQKPRRCVCKYPWAAVVESLSCVQLFVTPWTVAHQAPLSMGFSRQEYWSGLPFPPPRDLPNPGIEPSSPALASRFFTTEPAGKPTPGQSIGLNAGSTKCGKKTGAQDSVLG